MKVRPGLSTPRLERGVNRRSATKAAAAMPPPLVTSRPLPRREGVRAAAAIVAEGLSTPPSHGGGANRGGFALAGAVLLGTLLWINLAPPNAPKEYRLAGFTTSLKGRRLAQRRNAALAARALNGKTLRPGGTLSYNDLVHWSEESTGYVRAPVSVEGTLVPALGGGVCQTSTTLYNAALLAGLTVLERHPHTIAPQYCPPGRDAAVAWPGVDLRLKNPYPFAVTLRAGVAGDHLQIEVIAPKPRPQSITLETQVVSRQEPAVRTVPGARPARGVPGIRAVTFRSTNGLRARLTDDTYATQDTVIAP